MNADQLLGRVSLVLGAIFGFAATLFWMWVAWRAMRAHERIANSLEAPVNQKDGPMT
jgi:hypothetical protein